MQRELGVGIIYRPTVEADLKKRDLKILHVPDLEKIRTKAFIIYNRCNPLSDIARDFLHALHESRISKVERRGLREIILFLASDAASYITDQAFNVNCGSYMI